MNKKRYKQDRFTSLAAEHIIISRQLDTQRYFCLLPIILLIALFFVAILGIIAPSIVSAQKQLGLKITGDGVANPVTFSLEELQSMEQYEHIYSTVNTWPTKRWYVGKGIKLRDLLAIADLKKDAQLIVFTSTDGYSITLTVQELLRDSRYYFPGLMENSASDGSIPGSPEGALEVEPILALLSAEGSNNPAHMNDMNSLQLICGQRVVNEQTNTLFLKYVEKIEVLTIEPAQWDNPRVNIGSGQVAAGTLLELNTKGSDADKIYFTTDGSIPTINSPMFNWSAKRWWSQRPDTLSSINKPIEIKEGTVIKAITIGPGRADSEVVTFIYQIGDPNQPQIPGGPPQDITLDEEHLQLPAGASFELRATVGQDHTFDQRVTWTSSDTSVAVVDNNGLVTVVGLGTAVITVITEDGALTASCEVTGINKHTANKITEDGQSSNIEDEEQVELLEAPQQQLPVQPRAEAEGSVDHFMDSEKQPDFPAEQQLGKEEWQYLESRGKTEQFNNAAQVAGEPGLVYEVSATGILDELPDQSNSLRAGMLISFSCLFFYGAVRRYREYLKEVAR